MKHYECEYTWFDVLEAVKRCLEEIHVDSPIIDIEKYISIKSLILCMNEIAVYVFIKGDYFLSVSDINLIKQAYIQLGDVGYIGRYEK